ncbi:MAG: DUF2341 domain-containing protein, partial [Promethearchaeota archaeon]
MKISGKNIAVAACLIFVAFSTFHATHYLDSQPLNYNGNLEVSGLVVEDFEAFDLAGGPVDVDGGNAWYINDTLGTTSSSTWQVVNTGRSQELFLNEARSDMLQVVYTFPEPSPVVSGGDAVQIVEFDYRPMDGQNYFSLHDEDGTIIVALKFRREGYNGINYYWIESPEHRYPGETRTGLPNWVDGTRYHVKIEVKQDSTFDFTVNDNKVMNLKCWLPVEGRIGTLRFATSDLWPSVIYVDNITGSWISAPSSPASLLDISLSTGTPFDDYQVRLDLDDRIDFSRCLSSGKNLRFFNPDDRGNPPAYFNYWVEAWDVANQEAIVWVKVPSAGTREFILDYGGTIETSTCDGDETFEFFDDFSSGSFDTVKKWDVSDVDQYSKLIVEDGVAIVNSGDGTSKLTHTSWLSALYGFTDYSTVRGVTYGSSLSGAVFYGDGSFVTSDGDNCTLTNNPQDMSWVLSDMAWVSSDLAIFSMNDGDLVQHVTNIPATPYPLKFVARSCDYPYGRHYATALKSIDDGIGHAGRAVRMRSWMHSDHVVDTGSEQAEVRVDWVFVRKCSEVEPVLDQISSFFPPDVENDTRPPLIYGPAAELVVVQGESVNLSWTIASEVNYTCFIFMDELLIYNGSLSTFTISIEISTSIVFTVIAINENGFFSVSKTFIRVLQPSGSGGGLDGHPGLNLSIIITVLISGGLVCAMSYKRIGKKKKTTFQASNVPCLLPPLD